MLRTVSGFLYLLNTMHHILVTSHSGQERKPLNYTKTNYCGLYHVLRDTKMLGVKIFDFYYVTQASKNHSLEAKTSVIKGIRYLQTRCF